MSLLILRPKKKKEKCVFQVTWNIKIGIEDMDIFLLFFKNWYMGMMGNSMLKWGNPLGIPKNPLKEEKKH